MRPRDEQKEVCIRRKAIEMVVKEGLEGFSMQKLAREACVSPATLYIYYKDKDDLILKLSMELNHQMFEYSLKDFDPEMHFEEGLRRQWINRSQFFIAYPQEMQFIEQIRYSQQHEKVREYVISSFSEVMSRFVRNAIQRKELTPLPLEVYWSVAFAPLYQLIRFHHNGESIGGHKFRLTDEILDLTLQVVLKALRP